MRPQSTCICQWIMPTAHAVEVVVLQHPLEVANAKGSARLLCLSLPHSKLVTGEVFAEQALQALLTAPLQPQAVTHRPDQLSTLEATCAALMQLEGSVGQLAPLLRAFDGFVAQQLGYRTR